MGLIKLSSVHCKDCERLRVQLAGCGVAALGYGKRMSHDTYGWSQSYQDVMNLRDKYKKLLKEKSK